MIEVVNVTKRYGAVQAVDGVSLDVRPGEPVVIQGPSGSGKTTLLRLIAGLELADAGRIRIAGAEGLPPHLRRIGFVFQEPALWPHMTVEQHIRFAGADRAREMLERAGLAAAAGRYPKELSGGEAARAALARALAANPKYLLMDEPLAHLDGELRARQLEWVLEETARSGACLIWVTHDSDEARRIGGRRCRMLSGHLAQ